EEDLRARHVGFDEDAGTEDAPVDVTFRCEVEDRLDPVAFDEIAHQLRVGDVALDEDVLRVILQVRERVEVPGVRQLVEVDHGQARTLPPQIADEVRPDESGAPGDQNGWHAIAAPRPPAPSTG